MSRMRGTGTLIVLATFAQMIWPLGSVQAKTTTLTPYTAWNVDYGEKICTLRRGFGSTEKRSILIMNRFGPSDTFQLTIVSDEFKSFEQGQSLSLQFGEQKPRRITSVIPGKAGTQASTLFFPNVSLAEEIGGKHDEDDDWDPPVPPATEAATKSIAIASSGHERIFETGPLDKPFEALRKCTDNLVATWGLDPKQQATLSQRAKPLTRPSRWLASSDYPRAMLNVGKQAQVNFRLSIGANGAPTGCEVQSSYNDKKFDDVTCAILLRRARFSPALDAARAPVASYYLNTVRWIVG